MTTPEEKLEVNGNIKVAGTIRGVSWGFGGLFMNEDCYTLYDLINPLTGAMSCPLGFTEYNIGRFKHPESNCGATQYVCIK